MREKGRNCRRLVGASSEPKRFVRRFMGGVNVASPFFCACVLTGLVRVWAS